MKCNLTLVYLTKYMHTGKKIVQSKFIWSMARMKKINFAILIV